MNKEQKEIRCAELVAVLTDSRDILNELLAYSRQGLSVSNIVEYASLFAILNAISNNSESNKTCDIAQAWKQVNEVNFFYTEDDLREYYSQNANYSVDYDVLFDNAIVWEEYEAAKRRKEQLKEIAIQAALEAVHPNIRYAFIREYELNDEEVAIFENAFNAAKYAAEGRNMRRRRRDVESYYAYENRRDEELNAWCEDNGVVTPYNPNMAVDVLQRHGLFGLLGKVTVCHAKNEEEDEDLPF